MGSDVLGFGACNVCSQLALFHGEFGVCSLLLTFLFEAHLLGPWGFKSCNVDRRGRPLHYEPLNILEFMRPFNAIKCHDIIEASKLLEPY